MEPLAFPMQIDISELTNSEVATVLLVALLTAKLWISVTTKRAFQTILDHSLDI
jgi:hypothetical protein